MPDFFFNLAERQHLDPDFHFGGGEMVSDEITTSQFQVGDPVILDDSLIEINKINPLFHPEKAKIYEVLDYGFEVDCGGYLVRCLPSELKKVDI